MSQKNETERLEEIREAWQKYYDKGTTLTLADAIEIRNNIRKLAELLWSWEKKYRNDAEEN